MASSKAPPGTDHRPDPAAPVPVTVNPRTRRFPLASAAVLLGLALNLGLCVRRARGRAEVAFVAASHLNLLMLFWALRRFELSAPDSAARGRARLAVWLLTTTLTAGFTWKIGAMLPLLPAIAVWVMAAATVVGGFIVLFVLHNK